MDNMPKYSRSELIDYIKDLAKNAKIIGIDNLVLNKPMSLGGTNAAAIADYIAYAMDSQEWLTQEDEPELYKINEAAIAVDNDYTDRDSWERLLQLIEEVDNAP